MGIKSAVMGFFMLVTLVTSVSPAAAADSDSDVLCQITASQWLSTWEGAGDDEHFRQVVVNVAVDREFFRDSLGSCRELSVNFKSSYTEYTNYSLRFNTFCSDQNTCDGMKRIDASDIGGCLSNSFVVHAACREDTV